MWRLYVAVLPLMWLYISSVANGNTNETVVDSRQEVDLSPAATVRTVHPQNGSLSTDRTPANKAPSVAPSEKTLPTKNETGSPASATGAPSETQTAVLETSLLTGLESSTSRTRTLSQESGNNRTTSINNNSTSNINVTIPAFGDTSLPVVSNSSNSTQFVDYLSESEVETTADDFIAPSIRPPADIRDDLRPVIESGPQNKTVVVGDEVILRCRVANRQSVEVSWEYNGVRIRSDTQHFTFKKKQIKIKGASLEHAGWYRCSVSNMYGTVKSLPAYLRVEKPPEILRGPGDHRVKFGTILNLTCPFIASPPPLITWFENKINLREWTNHQFIIINATRNANYTCLFRNTVKGVDKLASKVGSVVIVGNRPPFCSFYNGAACRQQIGDGTRFVFAKGLKDVRDLEIETNGILNTASLNSTTHECRDAIQELVCHATYPDCSVLNAKLTGKPICKEDCELVQDTCGSDWGRLVNRNFDDLTTAIASLNLTSCAFLPSRLLGDPCTRLEDGSPSPETSTTHELSSFPGPVQSTRIPTSSRIIPGRQTPTAIGQPVDPGVPKENVQTKSYLLLILVIVIPSGIFLVIVVSFIAHRVKRHKYLAQFDLPKNVDLSGLKDNPMYGKDFNKSFNPHLAYLEYPRNDVVYEKDIGEGAFGRVFKATCPRIVQGEAETSTAVKMLKGTANRDVMEYFNREAQMIARFNNRNIIRLLGVCFVGRPLCLLLEYMAEGDLEDFLHSRSPSRQNSRAQSGATGDGLDTHLKLNMASQVANGMVYLNERRFVHRDIATRNCLVNNNLEVKISDFGLARFLGQKEKFVGHREEQIPIRWTAPEALWQYQFTFASDMWSFGVLLWELFSYAEQPYSMLSHEDVFMYTRQGHRLACPENTPDRVYQIMNECWQADPAHRPSFQHVHDTLTSMECEWMVNSVGAPPQQNGDNPTH